MTTAELLDAIRGALVADQPLNSWCLSEFSKAPTVFIGTDPRKDPEYDEKTGKSDYPAVAVMGLSQGRGDDRREHRWDIPIGVGLLNETRTVSGNSVVYEGLAQVERLRELVEDALYRARIASMSTSGDASSECLYPLFVSYTTVIFTVLKSTRRGLP
jgi:hypothetical protein